MTLLPRAGLTLAPLLSFFSPEKLLGGLSLSDVDHTIAHRDGTFFDKSKGALSSYAKGVLIANAAWVGWLEDPRPPAQLVCSLSLFLCD